MIELSARLLDRDWWQTLRMGIPAGFLIAAIPWSLPTTRGQEFWVILLLTWLIALGGFAHVVAGSGEAWLLMLDGRITAFQAVFDIIVPTLLGNVLGARACSRCWPMRRCAASCDSPMERWRRRTIP
jgi:formate/nitrite transporter FocA (FNT family)